jgi:hypothetical protein
MKTAEEAIRRGYSMLKPGDLTWDEIGQFGGAEDGSRVLEFHEYAAASSTTPAIT